MRSRSPEVFEAWPRRWPGVVSYALFGLFSAFFAFWTENAGAALFLLFALCAMGMSAWQTLGSPLLRVTSSSLEHRPLHTPSRRMQFNIFGHQVGGLLDRIEASEVAALEWDGVDNIGIRLNSGDIHSVSFLKVPKPQRAEARERILSFVEGAVTR